MSKEKQIDDIAKLICTYPQCIHHNIIGECANTECRIVDIAENLYKQGYRKQSEVVREFAEEVKLEFYREFDEIIPSIMADKIDDLVNKYTGEKI